MHTACVVGKNYRLQDIQLSKRRWSFGLSPQRISSQSTVPTASNPGKPCGSPNLVENTGLEPVTSWLQTRRSPS